MFKFVLFCAFSFHWPPCWIVLILNLNLWSQADFCFNMEMCSKDLCGVPVVCFSPFIICILKECHENFYLSWYSPLHSHSSPHSVMFNSKLTASGSVFSNHTFVDFVLLYSLSDGSTASVRMLPVLPLFICWCKIWETWSFCIIWHVYLSDFKLEDKGHALSGEYSGNIC